MYDRLMAATDRPDILAVLGNLRAASQERHLPAFQRCLARSGPLDGGCGGRRHRGGRGIAEALPFDCAAFNCALVATTICFVDSPARMLAEACRVLAPGGRLVIGFIDPDSTIGRHYVAHQAESVFYREAAFHSVHAVELLLRDAGFVIDVWGQTLLHPLTQAAVIVPLRPGVGDGAFVVVPAHSPK